jgi:hypothetical protein
MKMKMTEISEDKFDIYVLLISLGALFEVHLHHTVDRASSNSSELVPL